MTLASPAEAANPWVCPCCRTPIARDVQGPRCAANECGGEHPRRFAEVGGQPVLVDFEDSVLELESLMRAGGASAVERRSTRNLLLARLRRWTSGNPVSARFAADVLQRLGARTPRARVLVIGGGTIGIGAELLYETREIDLLAFDLYASPHTHAVADAHRIPLPDASVEAVWAQAVLEHVLDPARVVAEIHRVLRPQGLVYSEIPFLQQVHEGPYDFTRFTETGQRWLFRRFERLDSGPVAGPGVSLEWAIDHFVRGLTRSRTLGRALGIASSGLALLERWMGPGQCSDGASCLFFYGRRAERALSPREVVRSYRGAQAPAAPAAHGS